jgi:hypothetical protein
MSPKNDHSATSIEIKEVFPIQYFASLAEILVETLRLGAMEDLAPIALPPNAFPPNAGLLKAWGCGPFIFAQESFRAGCFRLACPEWRGLKGFCFSFTMSQSVH